MVTKHWDTGSEPSTPYVRAGQVWDDRIGSAVVQAKNWRLAAFASLGLVALSLGGMVYLGAQPKVVPHIVQVDQIGQATYRGPVGKAAAEYTPSDVVIKYHLRRFVQDTRTISSDLEVLRRNWLDAYALLTQSGANQLSAYIQKPGNDPFARARDERVAVEVLAAIPVSKNTWQLDWRESRSDLQGTLLEPPKVWRGMFRVVIHTSTTEAELTRNPIGLYIDEIHWDQVQG